MDENWIGKNDVHGLCMEDYRVGKIFHDVHGNVLLGGGEGDLLLWKG